MAQSIYGPIDQPPSLLFPSSPITLLDPTTVLDPSIAPER